MFQISELNKWNPDAVLVVFKDLVDCSLLQVLIGQVLVIPVLSEGENHLDEVLLLVNVEDPLDINGDVDPESLLDVYREIYPGYMAKVCPAIDSFRAWKPPILIP